MDEDFFMRTTSSLGKIVQRAPAVGAKKWCLYFFVTLRGRRVVRSTVTYFEQVLCRDLWVDFYIFFQHWLLFQMQLQAAATNFSKLRSEIAKSPKIGGKVCIYIFSTSRYVAQTAIVKIRVGSPKTARNEQVCVHQTSYRK